MTQAAAIPAAPASAARTLWLREARATIALAIPIALTLLAEAALVTTDAAFLGRLGETALAAAALAFMPYYAAYIAGMGVVTATAGLIAQALGARKPRTARRVVRQGLWISLLLGFPMAAAMLAAEPLLLALEQPAMAAAGAAHYLCGLAWALPFSFAFAVLRNFAAALDRPRLALWIILAALPANALLDYALIFGHFGLPRLEMLGAGIATAIVEAVMCIAMAIAAMRVQPLSRFRVLGRFWRPDWAIFRRIFAIGLPIAGILVMEFGLFAGAVVMLGWMGPTAIAAHHIALHYASITFRLAWGLAQAATVRVGHAFGRGDADGVRRAGWTALALGVTVMSLLGLGMWIWADTLPALFADAEDAANAELMALAATLLTIAAAFQMMDGGQAIGAGVLRGLNDTALPMVYGCAGYWLLGIPGSYLLGFHTGLGAAGVWWGLALGLGFVATVHAMRFRWLTRRGIAA
ncbi:MAG: MATE family efflux transporter [Alphaproteobacteria bacterium]